MPASENRRERRAQQRIVDYSKSTGSEPYLKNANGSAEQIAQGLALRSSLDDYTQTWLYDLYTLMLTRRVWTGLPLGVDARWLERCLALYGAAVITPVDKGSTSGKQYYKAQHLVLTKQFDDQGNFIGYAAQGAAGKYTSDRTPANSVIVWDNMARIPMHQVLKQWADDLGRLDLEIARNIAQQSSYAILYTDQSAESDAKKILAQSNTGIFGQIALKTDGAANDLVTPGVIQTGVAPIMDKLYEAMSQKLNQIYNKIGIKYIPHEKAERMVSKEASVGDDSVQRHRYSYMQPCLDACRHMRDIWGINATVRWNEIKEDDDVAADTADTTADQ